ncbi:MAG: DUF6513 domain-containing protein [Planctomycetota bacterium]
MKGEKLHLVTGKLAAHALEEVVSPISDQLGFDYTIDVLPITVAGLMTPAWVAKHIRVPVDATRILLPGYCVGNLDALAGTVECPLLVGPKDLRELPQFLGSPQAATQNDDGPFDIQIIAEINHAPQLPMHELVRQSHALRADGADIIDLGCIPGETWHGVTDAVQALIDLGHRVSIDSMNNQEIANATAAGAELVLSVNKANREAAPDWGTEVVAIPDLTTDLETLYETVEWLDRTHVSYRIDPIVEPIGFGFARSLQRYMTCRERYPEAEMMMGIGNLTELTDCDSAGINLLLLAICQELGIRSVLTTQVINWARTSVRECDVARRMVHHAITRHRLPKHLDDRLVMLRDPKQFSQGASQLGRLTDQIRDHNFRMYAEDDQLHLLTRQTHLTASDPFELLRQLEGRTAQGSLPDLSASHAFYLGFELCKAAIANQLGKQYRQDEPLNWGLLSHPPRDDSRTAENQDVTPRE